MKRKEVTPCSPVPGRRGHTEGKEVRRKRRSRNRRKRRRRRKRGRGNEPSIQAEEAQQFSSLRVFTNNIRGFTSKQESLNRDVIDQLRPDIINLSETLKKGNAEIKIKNYVSFSMNRPNGEGGGGISTSVAAALQKFATKVAGDNENDEYMVTRVDNVKPALNIVHIYGKIENREGGKPENVLKSWTKILNELRAIEARQECVLLCGDWNRAVGSGQDGVLGNKSKVSDGGRLIRDAPFLFEL